MKHIYEVIQREKMKKKINKEYIQLLQQIADKSESAKEFVKDVRTQSFLDKLYRDNIIELDDYFKYSGKTEANYGRGFTSKAETNIYSKPMKINNDMSKFKLKKQ